MKNLIEIEEIFWVGKLEKLKCGKIIINNNKLKN